MSAAGSGSSQRVGTAPGGGRWGRALLTVAVVALLGACEGGEDDPDGCPIAGEPELEIGVPDEVTFVDFQALEPGGDIPLSSNGQTFLAVQLAVRVVNLDRFATISTTVLYQPAEGEARVAEKDDSQMERLFCRSDGRLYHLPVAVSSEDLGNDLEIAGQSVEVAVTLTDGDGRSVSGQADGVLRRYF